MSLNAIDGRIVEKISTVPGQIPTVGPSFDHTDGTWIPSDVYEAEFFVNTADEKIYMVINGTVFELTTGGPVVVPNLASVLAAGNTTGANDIEIDIDQTIINSSSDASISLGTTTNPNNIDIITTQEIHITGNATGVTKELNMVSGFQEIKTTNGTNIVKTQYSDTNAITSATDGTDSTTLEVRPTQILGEVNSGTDIGSIEIIPNEITLSTNTTNINLGGGVTPNDIDITTQSGTIRLQSITDAILLLADSEILLSAASFLNLRLTADGVVLERRYTPSSSADPIGIEGTITTDDNYIYVKTSAGWKRSALSVF